MDPKEGNIKGALMQLNMSDQGIRLHEKEMMEMMNVMKQILGEYSGISNKTS